MESQTFVIKNEIKDSLAYFRKLEADVAILGNVNEKLKERLVSNKKQFQRNVQYSGRQCLEAVAIPTSVCDTALKEKEGQIFHEIGVEVGERNV